MNYPWQLWPDTAQGPDEFGLSWERPKLYFKNPFTVNNSYFDYPVIVLHYRSLKGLETPRWAYSIYNIQQERKKIGGYSVNPCSSTEIQQNDLILTTTSLKDLRR